MIFLFVSSSIVGMDSQRALKNFYVTCNTIDKKCQEKYRNVRRRILFQEDNADVFVRELHTLEKELREFKKGIDEKRKKTLEDFKEHYKIDDRHWNIYLKRVESIHKYNKKRKNCSLHNVVHDKNFPYDAFKMIKAELHKYGIKLRHVHLLCVTKSPFYYGVRVPMEKGIIVKNNRISITSRKRQSGCLMLNVDEWKKCEWDKKVFICISMVAEFVEKLSIMSKTLRFFWSRGAQFSDKNLDHKDLITLQNRARVLSLLSASLMSEKTACVVKKYAVQVVNSHFTSEDYNFLGEVEWRRRLLVELQDYEIQSQKIQEIVSFIDREVQYDESTEDD